MRHRKAHIRALKRLEVGQWEGLLGDDTPVLAQVRGRAECAGRTHLTTVDYLKFILGYLDRPARQALGLAYPDGRVGLLDLVCDRLPREV